MREALIFYVKGILMGITETIPGISGSTIALFLKIYERLIQSLHFFLPQNIIKIFSKNKKVRKTAIKNLDLKFLFLLILGMITAIFSFSHLIGFFIDNYRNYLFSLFVGFVIASTFLQGRNHFNKKNFNLVLLGLTLGISLLLLSPQNILGTSYFEIIISGIITITFGLLPGVSGSFMLLILGKYDYILDGVRSLDFAILFLFCIGLVIGVVLFVSLIKKMLSKHREKMLSFFFAFVLGSSVILIEEALFQIYLFSYIVAIIYLIIGVIFAILLARIIQ